MDDCENDRMLIVLCNAPDMATAQALTEAILEARLAACVNCLAPCESSYRWQGSIENTREWPLLIKTSGVCYAALEQLIRERHPFEVPEIVAWPVAHGLPLYLNWIGEQTERSR